MEQILRFGPRQDLVGILSRPSGGGLSDTVYVLFNSGVISRVGPHRNNVRLARALAEAGHWVLRFDLSGHGDSRPADGELDPRAQAVADLRAAMDYLEQSFGISHFGLIGLCSGAVYSYWTALADTRVTGLFMMDGFWYRTWLTKPIQYWKRLNQLGWVQAFRKLTRQTWSRDDKQSASLGLGAQYLASPSKPNFIEAMGALVSRNVAIKLLYSGSVIDVYSYGAQFRHAFGAYPWCTEIECAYRPDIDHTLLSQVAQRAYAREVLSWVSQMTSDRSGGQTR